MKTRSMTFVVGALAALLVVAVWYLTLYSGLRKEASDVEAEVETAEGERSALEAQVRQLRSVDADKERFEARLERLQLAVPDRAELASFVRSVDAIRAQTGVQLMSVAPAEPTVVSGTGTIQMTIQIDGDYFDVIEALRRLEDVDAVGRLVVIDSIGLTASADAGDTGLGPPPVSATLTARMFTGEVTAAVPGAGASTGGSGGAPADAGTAAAPAPGARLAGG
ncbi:MAG: hypothetical protein KatS3mg009_2439 [Acidimicrobiia bacterium]|nr:MAG: hypothetical protein KatS3mg009_2439 [Acidimicrobiia bacterium]